MDYNKYDCPVCERPLVEGDDIVVCPECGAPHHRKCYEAENHCAFESKHGENFDYEQYRKSQQSDEEAESESDAVTCPRCGAECPKGSFYCNKCGFPVGIGNPQQSQYNTNQQGGTYYDAGPFGAGAQYTQNFDPMVGINPEEDWGNGVTAGEISKYVQKNTLYFMRVFNNIKKFFKSRFNFAAFLISVPYLMYRKMYKIGAIIGVIFFTLLTAEMLIAYSPAYVAFGNAVEQVSAQSSLFYNTAVYDAFLSMSIENQAAIGIMMMCSLGRLALQIIVGVKANKWYFKHCINQVAKIKTQDNPQQALESSGGVNLAIAISMYAIYIIINYVPDFIG